MLRHWKITACTALVLAVCFGASRGNVASALPRDAFIKVRHEAHAVAAWGSLFVTRSPLALLQVANGPVDIPVPMSAPVNANQSGIRCRTPPAESFPSSSGGSGRGPRAGRRRGIRDNEDKRLAESRLP
jgi:hypothetical protein